MRSISRKVPGLVLTDGAKGKPAVWWWAGHKAFQLHVWICSGGGQNRRRGCQTCCMSLPHRCILCQQKAGILISASWLPPAIILYDNGIKIIDKDDFQNGRFVLEKVEENTWTEGGNHCARNENIGKITDIYRKKPMYISYLTSHYDPFFQGI